MGFTTGMVNIHPTTLFASTNPGQTNVTIARRYNPNNPPPLHLPPPPYPTPRPTISSLAPTISHPNKYHRTSPSTPSTAPLLPLTPHTPPTPLTPHTPPLHYDVIPSSVTYIKPALDQDFPKLELFNTTLLSSLPEVPLKHSFPP